MKPPFVRNPYNYDTNQAGNESGLDTGKETPVKQSFKDECDINTIINRFGLGYQLPQNLRIPQEGDFTGIGDFHTAMNSVREAQENFDQLHANVRARFDNDAGKFVDFCMDKANELELAKMGLLNKEATERLLTPPNATPLQPAAPAPAKPA